MSALRPVFSWSYQALDPGPACGRCPAQARQAHRGCLLSEVDRDRFRLHDPLRVYAKERVEAEESAEEREESPRRLLEWYLACADSADRVLTPMRRRVALEVSPDVSGKLEFGSYGAALAWCEAEQANLVASVHAALAAGWSSIACRLPLALWAFFTLRKPWAHWIATCKAGAEAARRCSDQAYENLRQALDIRHRIGYRYGEAETLVGLAFVFQKINRSGYVATWEIGSVRFERARFLLAAAHYRETCWAAGFVAMADSPRTEAARCRKTATAPARLASFSELVSRYLRVIPT